MLVTTELGQTPGSHQRLSHIVTTLKLCVKTKPLLKTILLLSTVLQGMSQRCLLAIDVLRIENYFLPHWPYLLEHAQLH